MVAAVVVVVPLVEVGVVSGCGCMDEGGEGWEDKWRLVCDPRE